MPGFWRLPIYEGEGKAREHVGFAYHYGTQRQHVDTGVREKGLPSRFILGEREYYELEDAIDAWKAQQGEDQWKRMN